MGCVGREQRRVCSLGRGGSWRHMSIEGVLAVIGAFGIAPAIVAIRSYYKALEKGLIGPRAKGGGGLSAEQRRQLEELRREKATLEARVQNLETIVCSVDLELNARLNRLAAEQSRLGLISPEQLAALPPSAAERGSGAAPSEMAHARTA